MASVIEIIAGWCAADHNFSAEARLKARQAFADTIGCMIAATSNAATLGVRQAFAGQIGEHGEAGAIGGGRASRSLAALVNGTAAHALEFDDNFHGATTHASAVLVPALLAVGEAESRSGADVVTAYLVGLEAQAAVGGGLNPSHYTAGWHSTSTVGCIGTAAGVAWLLGLDAAGIARAMSLAASFAGGLKRQFGTPAKPVHAGLAARNAIEAALLARAGMSGRLDVLEAPHGFLELLGGSNPPGWEGLTFGEQSIIETVGLATKRHPCCGASHRVIDMVLELRAQRGFSAGDVLSVEALVATAHARNLAYADPQDEMQARFSMQYCVALALLQERLRLGDFTVEAVRRAQVRALLGLTTVTAYSEEVERQATGRLPHAVTVTLRDGSVLNASKQSAKGTRADPLDNADRLEKFIDCCSAWMSAEEAQALYAELSQLDGQLTVTLPALA